MQKRHNKKRNTALLYEFLIRHISKCLVDGRKDEAKKAAALSAKYFGNDAPLRNELSLFSSFLKSNVSSTDAARRILEAVCKASESMNARLLDEQKSKLIKEINYTLKEEDFYNSKIPNYTVYASLQTLLNESRLKKKVLNVIDRVKVEENLCEYLTKPKSIKQESLKVNPNYSTTVYNFLIKRFHKKYEGKLNESQKKLLTQYSLYLISNKEQQLKEVVNKEVARIKNSLISIKDESIRKDQDLANKILECRKRFSSSSFEEVNESKILELLQYMRLIEEVES